MKPLIIIELPDYTTQQVHEDFIKHFQSMQDKGFLVEYEVIILHGAKARVYYHYINWLKIYYFKLKAWAILKIQKKKLF